MTLRTILKTKGLSKDFTSRSFLKTQKVVAVDHLDLEVFSGEIFGFLGANGAGKTTTLNMLVGITEPTSGTIECFGRPFSSGDTEPLRKIGYVPETTSLPGYFTVVELLDFYADLFALDRKTRSERITDLLKIFGLAREKNTLIRNLSMGQRRLVDFIQALVNDPDLVLLDEPTVYLDPVILGRFREILLALREVGKTIIMSSHMISFIERLSDRVAIIDRGKLLQVGPKEEFMRRGSMEEEFLRIVKSHAE
jgi:ABC-2 type transport system ATP-binding protein